MANKKRTVPEVRTQELLRVAVQLARTTGYQHITREVIAQHAGVSPALISVRLGTMPAMRRSVMRAAIADGVLEVVGQGLAARDPHALKAPDELKRRALEHMIAN
jgi:AcrR family transcriptional regulator